MTIKHLTAYLIGAAAALLLSASVGNAQTTGHDHSAAPTPGDASQQAQAAANQHAMMANMQAAQKKLDDLVAQMNAATGSEKVDRMAAVITEMAAMHKDMCAQMMNGGMMSMMMQMQHGAASPAAPDAESPDADHAGHHDPDVR
jgi:hypothetical protein